MKEAEVHDPHRLPHRNAMNPNSPLVLLFFLQTLSIWARPIPQIRVDLFSGTLTDRIPFDEPIILRGDVTGGITRVDVEVFRDGKRIDSSGWTKPLLSEAREFTLDIKPLKVEKNYKFRFKWSKELLPENREELESAARRIIQSHLQNFGWKNRKDLPDSAILALKKGILQALSGEVTFELAPGRGSVLDTLSGETVSGYSASLQPLLQAHLHLENMRKRIEPKIKSGIKEFIAVRNPKFAKQILDTLAILAKGNPQLAPLTAASGKAFEFLSIPTSDFSYLVSGAVAVGGKQAKLKSVPENSSPAELAIRDSNLLILSSHIDSIAGFFDSALNVESLSGILDSVRGQWIGIDTGLQHIKSEVNQIRELYGKLSDTLQSIDKIISQMAKTIEGRISMRAELLGSTSADFQTRAPWYVSNEIGILCGPYSGEFFPYLGLNIYLHPVNRDIPLSAIENDFFQRFALMVGVTLSSVEIPGQREGILGNNGIVTGMGLRVTDFVRISVGTVIFRAKDTNPLVDRMYPSLLPFLSLSADIDTKGLFSGLADAISSN